MFGSTPPYRDGDAAEELVELLVVANCKLDAAGNDAGLLVVAGSIAGELENLGSAVLGNSTEVHGSTSADARGVLALLQVAMHATDGELE